MLYSVSPPYEPPWHEISPHAKLLVQKEALRLIFVRIPKTGSSSIRKMMEDIGFTVDDLHFHQTYEMWRPFIIPGYTLVFTVVRNPFDMLASLFFDPGQEGSPGWRGIACKRSWKPGFIDAEDSGSLFHHTFDSFIREWCAERPPKYSDYLLDPMCQRSLYTQLFPEANSLELSKMWNKLYEIDPPPTEGYNYEPVDFIIRYERLEEGITQLFNNIGYPHIAIPHLNKNSFKKESDYKKYYTPELIKLVEQKHAQDLLHFGYNFDGPVDESIFIDPKSFSFSHRKPGVVPST